jgi:hypothetical protein
VSTETHRNDETAAARVKRVATAPVKLDPSVRHMGFRWFLEWTLAHYEVGVRIGDLSLGSDGVLPWGLVDNRPRHGGRRAVNRTDLGPGRP